MTGRYAEYARALAAAAPPITPQQTALLRAVITPRLRTKKPAAA